MNTLKTSLALSIIVFGMLIGFTASAQPGYRPHVSFETFYTELSPHGRWVEMPRYGKVWIYREKNFRPYFTRGHWVSTPLGWSWASDYRWGWAPFHYGRWEHDPRMGWFWIPGYEYAPAWVAWSEVDSHYGWAPLGFGVDIKVAYSRIPAQRWVYMPGRNIGHTRIDRYAIPYERNAVYYQRHRPVANVHVHNNVRYQRGPQFDQMHNAGSPAHATRRHSQGTEYRPGIERRDRDVRNAERSRIQQNNPNATRRSAEYPRPRPTVNNGRQNTNPVSSEASNFRKNPPSQIQNDILKRQRAIKAEVSRK